MLDENLIFDILKGLTANLETHTEVKAIFGWTFSIWYLTLGDGEMMANLYNLHL